MRRHALTRGKRRWPPAGVTIVVLLLGDTEGLQTYFPPTRTPLGASPRIREDSGTPAPVPNAQGTSSSSSSSGSTCTEQFTACGDDSTCLECTTNGEVNTSECLTVYPWDESSRNTTYFCHLMASTFCCSLRTLPHETATTCTADGPTMDYLGCVLEVKGCYRSDMPCEGDETLGVKTTPPPEGTSPSVAPSAGGQATPAPAGPSSGAAEEAMAAPTSDGTIRTRVSPGVGIHGVVVLGIFVASIGWLL